MTEWVNCIEMVAHWKRLCDECRTAATNAVNGAISHCFCKQELGELRAGVKFT